jgi:hypothetical protein
MKASGFLVVAAMAVGKDAIRSGLRLDLNIARSVRRDGLLFWRSRILARLRMDLK